MSENSFANVFQSFKPEDGCAWVKWDFSFPIFLHFAIVGPKDFNQNTEPSLLYEYPPNSGTSEYSIEHFIFFDPQTKNQIELPNESKFQWSFLPSSNGQSFTDSGNKTDTEELLILKSEANQPVYIYCLRFYASPCSRPATEDFSGLKSEMETYQKEWKRTHFLPLTRFAICFITSHPFYDFYFPILQQIIEIEARARMSAVNLFGSKDTSKGRSFYWPECSFDDRTAFLSQLYQLNLPIFGEYFNITFNNSPLLSWKMPFSQDVPHTLAQWGSNALLSWIDEQNFIRLISAILLEKYFIVIGRSISDIMRVVSFIPQLPFPFTWICPIITILPPDLFDVMDSPMANILGVRIPDDPNEANFLDNCLEEHKSAVIINLETKKINIPPNMPLMPAADVFKSQIEPIWPEKNRPKTIHTLLNILQEHLNSSLSEPIGRSSPTMHQKEGNDIIEGSMFIPELFMRNFPPEDHSFLNLFLETQLFSAFKEQICRTKTLYKNSDKGHHQKMLAEINSLINSSKDSPKP